MSGIYPKHTGSQSQSQSGASSPAQGPSYDDLSKTQMNPSQPGRDGQRPSPLGPGLPLSPLHAPPVGGPGGLGRSDLDPLGRSGAGNVMDPRGVPRGGGAGAGILPGLPGGVPPGARFDPLGPTPTPNRPDAGLARFEFNPDEKPPPSDYDDMFM